MNSGKLVLSFVRRKPLTWAFHVLALALGVGVITSLLLLGDGLNERFRRDLADKSAFSERARVHIVGIRIE